MSDHNCFTCLCTARIREIAETVATEKRAPTEYEMNEAEALQRAVIAEINERTLRRTNIYTAIMLGVI